MVLLTAGVILLAVEGEEDNCFMELKDQQKLCYYALIQIA